MQDHVVVSLGTTFLGCMYTPSSSLSCSPVVVSSLLLSSFLRSLASLNGELSLLLVWARLSFFSFQIERAASQLRRKYFAQLLAEPTERFSKESSGTLLNRLSSNPPPAPSPLNRLNRHLASLTCPTSL